MKTGLLWYDDDPKRNLAEKIGRAARRYRQKFNASPTVCYVHPSALLPDSKVQQVNGVRVSSKRPMLPHHFWVGVETERSET